MDLNDAPKYGPLSRSYNRDQISLALRLLAELWVPDIFKRGRLVGEGGKRSIRCSDIKGNPPKNRGSCRIWITGENAGDWCDFEDRDNFKGGPLSTIKEHFGLDDGQAFEKALSIIAQYGGDDYLENHPKLLNGHAAAAAAVPDTQKSLKQVEFYWGQRQPAIGSPVENYWRSRMNMDLPACAFGSPAGDPDMVFIPWATNYKAGNVGFHTMACRFRLPDGAETGAIHLTHLLQDGSWHIGREEQHKDHSKIVWGSRVAGGVVMLAPIAADGALGIGEGIETTAAGMAYYGCAGWAAGDTAAMVKTGEWLAANPSAAITQSIKRLLIFGDKGRGGEVAAQRLAGLAQLAGVPQVELYYPAGGDDLAADRAAGYPPPPPIIDHWPAEPGLPLGDVSTPYAPLGRGYTESELHSRLMAMDKETPGSARGQILRDMALSSLASLAEDGLLTLMGRKLGVGKKLLVKALAEAKAEIIPPEHFGVGANGQQAQPWRNKMAISETGDPKGIMSNVAILLRECEDIRGSLGFNEFDGNMTVLKKLPWEKGAGNPCDDRQWTDGDELAMTEWVQSTAGIHATRNVVFDAAARVANEFVFHPVRQMLDDAHANWDRQPRLDMAAVWYFGAEDAQYTREVFKRWLLSAVARIYRPGIKADCMTVFEGPQGLRKSTAIRVLFDPWFTDQLSEVGSKDSSLELRGIWCAEYSDLEGMNNSEAARIKAYMSQTFDYFRPPYGRTTVKLNRQNVFGATTNEHFYLKDATGARRFWPIPCGNIDIDMLYRDRDMLWGEAVELFRQKTAVWWIDEKKEPELSKSAALITDARYQVDGWEDAIKTWLSFNGMINCTTSDLMIGALQITDRSRWGRYDQIRLGRIMSRIGWVRARDKGGNRDWRYWRPGSINLDLVDL